MALAAEDIIEKAPGTRTRPARSVEKVNAWCRCGGATALMAATTAVKSLQKLIQTNMYPRGARCVQECPRAPLLLNKLWQCVL